MRVKPIFKYSLVAGALALPGVAYPLGLGKLTVDSFVGQPLVARIELLSSSKEELDTLSAKIADPNLYKQNNLQYQGVLSRTRVGLERGPGDTAYLKAGSRRVFRYVDSCWMIDYARGNISSMFPYGIINPAAYNTLDTLSASEQVANYAELVIKSMFGH